MLRNPRALAYLAMAAAALLYLAVANAKGYMPFASNRSHVSTGTASHFHK
jgi:hypothetical protein